MPKTHLLQRTLSLESGEGRPAGYAFASVFCIFCAYFILRPVRDEMGIQGGVDALAWVFSATFVTMLAVVPAFGWAVARYSRRGLVLASNGFFIANLLAFFVLMRAGVAPEWVARAFFVWVSVFNLFVVSLFWSVMNDAFDPRQALRLFGLIAAGGSLGAVAGPAITALTVERLGTVNLLPISVVLLILGTVLLLRVMRMPTAGQGSTEPSQETRRESVWAGAVHVARSPYLLGICAFFVLYTTLSTFLYFTQAHIVEQAFNDSADRTRVFAGMDLAINVITLIVQFFATARLVKWLGLPIALALIPVAVAAGFGVLGLVPTLAVLVVFQVIRRAGNFALTRPAREMLFGVIPREDKYKAKNFIDTVIYRGGDAASGWLFTGLTALGLGLSGLAFAAVPLALVWAVVGFYLGRSRERRDADMDQLPPSRRASK